MENEGARVERSTRNQVPASLVSVREWGQQGPATEVGVDMVWLDGMNLAGLTKNCSDFCNQHIKVKTQSVYKGFYSFHK